MAANGRAIVIARAPGFLRLDGHRRNHFGAQAVRQELVRKLAELARAQPDAGSWLAPGASLPLRRRILRRTGCPGRPVPDSPALAAW